MQILVKSELQEIPVYIGIRRQSTLIQFIITYETVFASQKPTRDTQNLGATPISEMHLQ